MMKSFHSATKTINYIVSTLVYFSRYLILITKKAVNTDLKEIKSLKKETDERYLTTIVLRYWWRLLAWSCWTTKNMAFTTLPETAHPQRGLYAV